MYKKIVIALALDHGLGHRAIEVARRLCAEDGEMIAVHVLEQVPAFAKLYITDEKNDEIRSAAEAGISERIGDAKDANPVVLVGHPGRSITDYAEQCGADCIVVGSHKPGLQDFLLGSTAARIVRHSPCSVHVLR